MNQSIGTRTFRIVALVFAALVASPAVRSAEIVRVKPATPQPLQMVSVDILVGGCDFRPSTRMDGNLITVMLNDSGISCSPPVPPSEREVSLGSFPTGSYQVVLHGSGAPPQSFTVGESDWRLSSRAFTQSGTWWDPRFPGAGVFIQDAFPGRRAIMFSTHEPSRTPVVYTMVLERAEVTGTLYRVSGTPAALAPLAPDLQAVAVGSGTLLTVFEGRLVFLYEIDGLPPHRLLLERFPF